MPLSRRTYPCTLLGLPNTRSLTTPQGGIRLPLVVRVLENIGCIHKEVWDVNAHGGAEFGETPTPGELSALRADYSSCSTYSMVSPLHPGHPTLGINPG